MIEDGASVICSEVAGSFKQHSVEFSVFDDVLCEPSEQSMIRGERAKCRQTMSRKFSAVDFAKKGGFDCFIAVGGGSVIDTCKVRDEEVIDIKFVV